MIPTLESNMAQPALEAEEHSEEVVSDETAESRGRSLIVVQRLLRAQGIRSYTIYTVNLKLFGNGRPAPLGQRTRLAPELRVTDPQGWRDATVTVGPRSGCYLVSLRNGPNLQTVREPQQVADLILGARPGGRA
jgi:hypothetical protein